MRGALSSSAEPMMYSFATESEFRYLKLAWRRGGGGEVHHTHTHIVRHWLTLMLRQLSFRSISLSNANARAIKAPGVVMHDVRDQLLVLSIKLHRTRRV